MRAYYYYAEPRIGGDSSDDDPPLAVPNYYSRVGSWRDRKTGQSYGVLAPDNNTFIHFWKDDAGNPHPDARDEVDVWLRPGERYEKPSSGVFIFAGAPGDERPWQKISRQPALSQKKD